MKESLEELRGEGAQVNGSPLAAASGAFEVPAAGDTSVAEFTRRYLRFVTELLTRVDEQAIAKVVEVLLHARAHDRMVFLVGKGGSAATAGHFASDLAMVGRSAGPSVRAVSLSDGVASLTATANDCGYDEVFRRQLEALLRPGDVVVALSVSGDSPNVLNAVRYANQHGGVTVGFTGSDGGQLRALAQVQLHVPSSRGDFGPIEDVHLICQHIVTNFLRLARRQGPAA